MSDRAQAIEVLKQVRDRLARQLMEHVLDAPEEILEEADGVSYGGRIETIYEHFGSRLANVSSMMGQLQMLDDDDIEERATSSSSFNAAAPTEDFATAATIADTLTPPDNAPAISGDQRPPQLDSPSTWETFVEYIRQDDRPAAVRTLAELFDLDTSRAERCVKKFAELCGEDSTMFARAQQMRPRLRAASMNDALAMLWRLFALQGPEAVGAYQALRVNIERRATEPESHE